MNRNKLIGLLLIAGAAGALLSFTFLSINFEYPDILRQDPGIVLTKFHERGPGLILNWWIFAIAGVPLLIAYILIGQGFSDRPGFSRWMTTFGVISIIVQLIGLLRWVFVIPVIANSYTGSTDPVIQQSAIISFQTVHQLGGVLLGEHLGQLFTVIWTIMLSVAFMKLNFFPKWVSWFGIFSAVIYFLAQAELFATVISGFPVWSAAGMIGSSLWLLWLIIIGILFIRKKQLTSL